MLSVNEFGRALVVTGDLDPIYLMLEGAQLDRAALQRWCLAYWMFYHAGVASHLSEMEGSDFWESVEAGLHQDPFDDGNTNLLHNRAPAAVGLLSSGQFPRGTERRHFRGKAADQSVAYLVKRFGRNEPEMPASSLDFRHNHSFGKVLQYTAVARYVQEWRGFGPWIAFKVADMLDAVLGVPVNFEDGFPGNIFEDPAKGAVWAQLVGGLSYKGREWTRDELLTKYEDTSTRERRAYVEPVFRQLLGDFKRAKLTIPHRPGQDLRIQEVETVLCKWKSHINGHYEVGKDTKEILHALEGWGPTAERCRYALRKRTEYQP